ncbi:class I SAM-dependent methyltransferase [Oleispirillum naphthae]|uniref:class I SAM-dependent methyltransferase n=1 Tax=Oleispirillum naphthae TaxID=2838853 RepID=UPI0030826977
MKALLLRLADLLATIWRLLPERLRTGLITGILVLDSRHPDPAQGLRRLMAVRDRLELVTAERAMAYGKGEHPKHRLTRYHDFFIDRIGNGDRVLDVGCGYGAVARSIARARPGSTVLGIDMNKPRLAQAMAADNPPNLSFVEGDATRTVPEGGWNVVVLSNVLEHIVDRVGFLSALTAATGAERFLIRVPHFSREWQMALRKELGVNYYGDDDHKIEHTLAEFRTEMESAGLSIAEVATPWGEIWADCRCGKGKP